MVIVSKQQLESSPLNASDNAPLRSASVLLCNSLLYLMQLTWALKYILNILVQPASTLSLTFQSAAEGSEKTMSGLINLDAAGMFAQNEEDLRRGAHQSPVPNNSNRIAAELRREQMGNKPTNLFVDPQDGSTANELPSDSEKSHGSTSMSVSSGATPATSLESGEIRAQFNYNFSKSGEYPANLSDDEQFAERDDEQSPKNTPQTPIQELRRSTLYEEHDFTELRTLDSGGNGKCFLLQEESTKALVVCKVTRPLRSQHQNDAPREVQMLRDIIPRHNPRILQFYHSIQTPSQNQIYTEYLDGGDLSNLIHDYRSAQLKMPESFIWHAFQQLAEAVAFIHWGYDHTSSFGTQQLLPQNWRGVIHADLKPANVFLRLPQHPGQYPDLVLGDFGAAHCDVGYGEYGTYEYAPPEIPMFSPPGDVWSMGAVIYALAKQGRTPVMALPPWMPRTTEAYTQWCRRGDTREVLPLKGYSGELFDCVAGALEMDWSERPDCLQVLGQVHYERVCGVASPEIWEPLLPRWMKGGGWGR